MATHQLLALLERNGTVRSIAPGITRLTGLDPCDYVGRDLLEHVHPEDRQRSHRRHAAVVHGTDGTRNGIRVRLATKDGDWRWLEMLATRCLDEPGIGAVVVSVQDVSSASPKIPRVPRAEEEPAGGASRPSEDFLRMLLSISANAVLVLNEDSTIKWASSGVGTAAGYTEEEFARLNPVELVHPDDIASLGEAIDSWRSHEGQELPLPTPVTVRIRHRNRGWRWTDVVGRDLRENPAFDGLALAITDSHERVLAGERLSSSERRHRALLRNSHDRVLLTDRDGIITWASESRTRSWKWDPKDIVGVDLALALGEEDRATLKGVLRRCVSVPGHTEVFEAPLLGTDEGIRWRQMTVCNQLDDPDVAAVVWNLRDVQAEHDLESASVAFGSLAVSSSTGLFEIDQDARLVDVNPRWEEITGMTAAEAAGNGWQAILVDEMVHAGPAEREPGPQPPVRLRIRRPDGEYRWVDVRSTVVIDADGRAKRFGGIEDATAEVRAEQEHQSLLEIFGLTEDTVMVVDAEGRLVFINRTGRDFFGLSEQEYESRLHTQWPLSLPKADGFGEIMKQLGATGWWSGEVESVSANGDKRMMRVELMMHRDEQGRARQFSTVTHDITETKQLEASLEYEATHDQLTGLPNRLALLRELGEIAEQHHDSATASVALLFIDLDHFKVVNDSLGHEVGDQLLQQCARRIGAVVRPDETVTRFGGDEFVVVCQRIGERSDADSIAERIDAALTAPFDVEEHQIHTGVSIGIAHSSAADLDPASLLRDADTAMYHAKSTGRRCWATFDDELRRAAVSRHQLERELRAAVESEDFTLAYQPVARLDDFGVVGVETLLRWRMDGQSIPPDTFVPVAEDTGLIIPIGTWVMRSALDQLAQWDRHGLDSLAMAVNVSVRQLQAPGFVASMAELIESRSVDPSRICLEITETVLLEELKTTRGILGDLTGMGINIALDDFGTGYSPLTYLKELPIDVVKLDRSFVAEIGSNPRSTAIATAVVSLASAIDLAVIADGIETESQREALAELGCTLGQGRLISAPLPAADLPAAINALTDRP